MGNLKDALLLKKQCWVYINVYIQIRGADFALKKIVKCQFHVAAQLLRDVDLTLKK